MDVLDCKICHNPYDENNHKPRVAPCGHELCTSCIRGLIKDSTLMCPKCRNVSKVEVPDDLPINFGLIDVMRSFKAMNIPSSKKSESFKSGATNDELCSIHCKSISHWCLKCQIWICNDCLEFHSSLIGCSTEDMDCMKDKNIKDTNIILAAYEEDAKSLNAKLQEHTKLVEKHTVEANKIRKLLDQGNAHKEIVMECKKGLDTENSPHVVIEGMKLLTQRKQLLRNWSAMNIRSDIALIFSKALANKKDVFTEMVIKSEKLSAKLSKHEETIYLHTFWKQAVADDSIYIPFEDLKKEIPPYPSLVFLELRVEDVDMGKVLLRLNKKLPNIREYIVKIVIGQNGNSLREVVFNSSYNDIYASTSFSELPVIADKNYDRVPTAKYGDILGEFRDGYLSAIYCYLSKTPSPDYEVVHLVGTIEHGMDILLDFYNKHTSHRSMMISDCGLVLEKQ